MEIAYRGVLDDAHVRAVTRLALRARGFSIGRPDFFEAMENQRRLGIWLRDEAVPIRFPPFADIKEYRALARVDPYLWDRLVPMLGLGFRQATVVHDLVPASPDIDASVAFLGGVFNAAIAIVDYLIANG